MKTNFHTHTSLCRHADGTAEDYVKSAVSNGLTQLGFSDHGPYPDIDLGQRMLFEELEEYLNEIDSLAAKYKQNIQIRKGLEIEYLPRYRDYYEQLLTKRGLEYLLMGEHFYINPEGERANIYEVTSSTGQYLAYARTVAEGMKTGLFAAVAHPDLYMLNPFAWNDDCRRAADLIIDTAVATDTILDYLLRNNAAVKNGGSLYIGATRWCKGAGTGGADRMVVYVNHERFLQVEELVPLARVMSQPNATEFCYDTAYAANLSEVELFYPQTMQYFDGI